MMTWLKKGPVLTVGCTVDVEHTNDSLHAYVDLDDVEIGPGDKVTVIGAPLKVEFGERVVTRCSARIERASIAQHMLARLGGYLELTELYEVGFDRRAS